VEINPQKQVRSENPVFSFPDTLNNSSGNKSISNSPNYQPDNLQSTFPLPEGGKVTVEILYSEAAENSQIDLQLRQPNQETLIEYANHNAGFTWVSPDYLANTDFEIGIYWYWENEGTLYQGSEAGAEVSSLGFGEYFIGFEAAGDDWDYNELVVRVKIETCLPIVFIDPPNISTGETATVTVKKQFYDGRIEAFDAGQLFEYGMMEGCAAGVLISGSDTSNYFNSVTQPVTFLAADSLENDEETVKIGVGVVEQNPSSKMKTKSNVFTQTKNLLKDKKDTKTKDDEIIIDAIIIGSCFGGDFESDKVSNSDLTVLNDNYEIEIINPTKDAEEWITAEPKMPEVICKAKLKNYDKGEVTFEWEYWISYTLLRHKFKSIDTLMRRTGKIQICGKSYSNNSEITSWEVPFDKDSLKYVLLTVKQPQIPGWTRYGGDNSEKRTSWNEGDEIFFGGDVFLQITAKNNKGKIKGFKQQNSGKIHGKNPFPQDVLNYITSKEFKAIVKHEALSEQFNENYINKYNEKGYPIYGPPNGYGLAQIDNPPPLEMDLWNWKSNLNRGKSIYDDKKVDAYNFMQNHPNTYTEEMLLKCAFQKYNMYGYEEETKIIHYFWKWDNYQRKWVDDEYIIARTKAKGFKERYGITIWNIYKGL